MNVTIFQNQQLADNYAYGLFKKAIKDSAKVVGLATGSTPLGLYGLIAKNNLDLSKVTTVNLDEYVGLEASHPQSYHYFMEENLFSKARPLASYLPKGDANDLEQATKDYDEVLRENPIDLQILGIGENGHIGFNEPGSPFDATTRVVDLTESTINSNKRFFSEGESVPTQAVTMGIGSILEAKQIILMAYGENKAKAVQQMIEGEVSTDLPASALQNHPNVHIILDQEAAKLLSGGVLGDTSIETLSVYSEKDARELGELMPQLNQSLSGSPIDETLLRKIIDSPLHDQLVARDKSGKIIGTATLSIVLGVSEGIQAGLESFVVSPEVRGKGVSSQLWQEIILWCQKHQVKALNFTSSYNKEAAHKFYLRHGCEIRDTAAFRKTINY